TAKVAVLGIEARANDQQSAMRPSPQSSLRERGEGGARAARGLVERVVGERYRGDFPFRTNPPIWPCCSCCWPASASAPRNRHKITPPVRAPSNRCKISPSLRKTRSRQCTACHFSGVGPQHDATANVLNIQPAIPFTAALEYHQPHDRPADLSA